MVFTRGFFACNPHKFHISRQIIVGTDISSCLDCTQNRSFYLIMESKTITVEYARQKLGKRALKMTDKEIEKLLVTLRLLCNKTIDNVVGDKL